VNADSTSQAKSEPDVNKLDSSELTDVMGYVGVDLDQETANIMKLTEEGMEKDMDTIKGEAKSEFEDRDMAILEKKGVEYMIYKIGKKKMSEKMTISLTLILFSVFLIFKKKFIFP